MEQHKQLFFVFLVAKLFCPPHLNLLTEHILQLWNCEFWWLLLTFCCCWSEYIKERHLSVAFSCSLLL